jgi:hypothetical protein
MSRQLSTSGQKGAFCTALAGLAASAGHAPELPKPDLHRANEYGTAAQGAEAAFDGEPIEEIQSFDEGPYRVWSGACSAEVVISYPFDALRPLSVLDALSAV